MPVRRWFHALAGLQVAFLAAWAGYHEAVLRVAPTILLDTRPYDPREILRGDFITLNYVVSTIPASLVSPPLEAGGYYHGEPICVTLARQGEFWGVAAATQGRCDCAAPPPDGPYQVEGMIQWGGGSPGEDVRVDYGIGRYYVPEGKGSPSGKITARVAVARHCRAFLKEIYLDGRPYP